MNETLESELLGVKEKWLHSETDLNRLQQQVEERQQTIYTLQKANDQMCMELAHTQQKADKCQGPILLLLQGGPPLRRVRYF
ncbi:MAG: hypothetical protein GY820_29655 [Gammaproteobacteria bacterium]|nr:hypothetical protein [Gammaproteobacteria bacterium]